MQEQQSAAWINPLDSAKSLCTDLCSRCDSSLVIARGTLQQLEETILTKTGCVQICFGLLFRLGRSGALQSERSISIPPTKHRSGTEWTKLAVPHSGRI